MESITSIIGTFLGVAGLVYAVYENRQRKKLNEYIRAHNWFSYQRANNAMGTVQLAKKLYLDKHKGNWDAEVLEQLSKADAFGQEVYKEVIRQIHYFEPSFTAKDFNRWKKEGKLNEDKESLFKQFAIDAKEQ